MERDKNLGADVDNVERDFNLAFERLREGKPTNPKLKAHAKSGALRISIVAVAAEAGHSRTLIGHIHCKYPGVRDKILALRNDPEAPTRLGDIIARKREECATLRRRLSLAQTENATLLIRIVRLEERVRKAERRGNRLESLIKANGLRSATVTSISKKKT